MSTILATLKSRRWYIAALVILLVAGVLGFRYWQAHWRPDRTFWPMQGVAVSPENAPFRWTALNATGARFAYIDAVRNGRGTGAFFTQSRSAALAAGMHVGPVLRLSMCTPLADQVTAFVRLVPREPSSLPPLVLLDLDDSCDRHPTRALILSEIGTLVNQLETHAGKAVIVGLGDRLTSEYDIAGAINRPTLLSTPRAVPDAETAPWALWLANEKLRLDGAEGSVGWLVLNDSETQ